MNDYAPKIARWTNQAELATKYCFISDLHCFSSRSTAAQHDRLIGQVIERSDVCVWGGDLFDFRWSQLGHEDESIAVALQWLERFYQNFPSKQFVFLSGNHDAHQAFVQQLHQWALPKERFQCGLDALITGDTLFLHGDVIEGGGSDLAFSSYRRSWQNKPIAKPHASKLYDAAVRARLHNAVAFSAHRRRRTCQRLIRWIDRQDAQLIRPVRRVVFGHTHRRIDCYQMSGFEFYNGGAAIKHVKFHPVELTV
ncbi:MAG: metallophosphoesterase [Pirellulaceae bacterium]